MLHVHFFVSFLKSVLYIDIAVLNNSVKWSSVNVNQCMGLIIFMFEYKDLQDYVIPKIDINFWIIVHCCTHMYNYFYHILHILLHLISYFIYINYIYIFNNMTFFPFRLPYLSYTRLYSIDFTMKYFFFLVSDDIFLAEIIMNIEFQRDFW